MRWPFRDRRNSWLTVCAATLVFATVLAAKPLCGQTAESLSTVKRVALEWSGTDRGSAATRDRVAQKLKASRAVELVATPGDADGILRGDVKVWINGYISTSPRSNSPQQPVYRGYASAELTGKDGRVLWSYLAAPRSAWKSVTDDLGDQLAQALLAALAKKDATTVGESTPANGQNIIKLQGIGSTFTAPLYQKWFESFTKVRPDLKIFYAAVGSEEGIESVSTGRADFGASDRPLAGEKLNVPSRKLLQIATVLGAVVPIYKVEGTADGLNLTGPVLADIFIGKIKKWSDPEIRALNKHARLPDEPIIVIHRSDGAGTTFVWTDYLSKVSADWKSSVGAGTTVKWPIGTSAERNDGVAEAVHKTPNSIGYVELLYALQHELDYASVRNASGEFVKADLDSVTAAARTAEAPADGGFSVSITNARGKHVYPIATFTWLLLPESADATKKTALRDLARWMLTTGQKQCEGLGYAPLPPELANRELRALDSLD